VNQVFANNLVEKYLGVFSVFVFLIGGDNFMIFDLDHQKPITPYGSLSHPFTPQVFPCRGF